jgi:hypothetical protein
LRTIATPLIYTHHDITIQLSPDKMKTAIFALVLSMAASLASAAIVITPITDDQIVEKMAGDCPFGVVTPQGCG